MLRTILEDLESFLEVSSNAAISIVIVEKRVRDTADRKHLGKDVEERDQCRDQNSIRHVVVELAQEWNNVDLSHVLSSMRCGA